MDARAAEGVQIGDGNLQINVKVSAPAVARSGYLHQIRRLGSPHFSGRQDELAEMARFCTAEDGPDYFRWLAPAWVGKTALMAQFALHPPAGVRVVAFFVTARLAGQSDRAAFCDVVQRQLSELLGEQEPLVTEHARDEQLLHALDRAARRSADRGERLVLLVDGLDEDRGVTSGPESHSIAALLPAEPPAGMRVLVAGRPNPPVPEDVPEHHPLRGAGCSRVLATSPHATAARDHMERELLRLLEADGPEHHLLGLLTAAGGGLSSHDLAELADFPGWRVRRHLGSVAGRTFVTQGPHWGGSGPEVYLLGHEELQRTAVRFLGGELAAYRERLHSWADRYRELTWPVGTPEYLLRGYPQLLGETRESDRLVRLVADRDRQDRLLELSGSDLASLAEITAAQDLLLTCEPVDLDAMLVLADHREDLHSRNGRTPASLISLWAELGETERAANLARSFADLERRTGALTTVVGALAHAVAGRDHARAAAELGTEAAELARSIPDWRRRARARTAIARALLETGLWDQALDVAGDAYDDARNQPAPDRYRVFAELADVAALAGDDVRADALLSRAVAIAKAVRLPSVRRKELAFIAATYGSREALDLFHRHVAPTDPRDDPYRLSELEVVELAGSLATIGDAEQALELAHGLTDPLRLAEALADVSAGLAWTGHTARAIEVFDTIADPDQQARVLPEIIAALHEDERPGEADRLLGEVVAATRKGAPDPASDRLLATAADLLAGTGRTEDAIALALTISDAAIHADALANVARSLARDGRISEARELARRATARAIARSPQTHAARSRLVKALVDIGETSRARAIADAAATQELAAPRTGRSCRSVAQAALASAHIGDTERTIELVERAVALASDSWSATGALVDSAVALVAIGRPDRALGLAHRLVDAQRGRDRAGLTAWYTAEIAEALVDAGHVDHAMDIAATILVPHRQHSCLGRLAGRLARSGGIRHALPLARDLAEPFDRADALARVAEALAVSGHPGVALTLVDEVLDAVRSLPAGAIESAARARVATVLAAAGLTGPAREQAGHALTAARSTAPDGLQASALVEVVNALAAVGQLDRAHEVARTITERYHRIRALALLAAKCGPTPSGRRMVAEAACSGSWSSLLEALTTVAPESLTVLADYDSP
ncbi:hypothetical protein ACGFX4_10745 [Kitasatospora sp. NPDC048365]|uniref:hypothetical protein n=1 Tax=Kitasatospora sp. NPDC048365 TaxID=3364050 RepID=UPI00371851F2